MILASSRRAFIELIGLQGMETSRKPSPDWTTNQYIHWNGDGGFVEIHSAGIAGSVIYPLVIYFVHEIRRFLKVQAPNSSH